MVTALEELEDEDDNVVVVDAEEPRDAPPDSMRSATIFERGTCWTPIFRPFSFNGTIYKERMSD